MRIVATLLVHDDADILDAWFQHHLAEGVGLFLVTAHRSPSATTDILSRYRDVIAGCWHQEEEAYRQSEWVSRMANAARALDPDWIVHLDADEFWTGFECLSRQLPDTMVVRTGPWRNHLPLTGLSGECCTPSEMPYFEIPGRTAPHQPRFAADGMGNGGKIAHRPLPDVMVGMGNHCLHSPEVGAAATDELIIHHYPVRSFDQFQRKCRNGAQSLRAMQLPKAVGGHWHHWDAAEADHFYRLYDNFLLGDREILERTQDGTLFRQLPPM